MTDVLKKERDSFDFDETGGAGFLKFLPPRDTSQPIFVDKYDDRFHNLVSSTLWAISLLSNFDDSFLNPIMPGTGCSWRAYLFFRLFDFLRNPYWFDIRAINRQIVESELSPLPCEVQIFANDQKMIGISGHSVGFEVCHQVASAIFDSDLTPVIGSKPKEIQWIDQHTDPLTKYFRRISIQPEALEYLAYRIEREDILTRRGLGLNPIEDGPFNLDSFRWGEVVVSGLSGLQWRLLEFLWKNRGKNCELSGIGEVVFQDRNLDTSETHKKLENLRYRTNRLFSESKIPFAIKLTKDHVTIIFQALKDKRRMSEK